MPTPSPLDVRLLANAIGVSLPESYLAFISEFDGAEPESNSLDGYGHVSVRKFIPVAEAAATRGLVEGLPSKMIPFAEDCCGNFTYIEPGTGSVYFWDHEVEGDQKIATDVRDFIARLTPFDVASVQLQPGQVEHAWIDPAFLESLKRDGLA